MLNLKMIIRYRAEWEKQTIEVAIGAKNMRGILARALLLVGNFRYPWKRILIICGDLSEKPRN